MRKWIIPAGSTAGAAGLRLIEAPSPEPGPGEVKIAVKACSTNYRDFGVAAGKYFFGPVKVDTVPLSDGAGEIVAIGPGVSDWNIGDRVAGIFFQRWQDGPFGAHVLRSDLGGPVQGMLAEEVVLPADGIVRIPSHLSFEEAATLPCAAVTAWNALFEIARARPGETVLTLGTGGVSIFALQFAKAAGLTVIATSSSEDKLQRARELGAAHTINYRATPDWDAEVLKVTDGAGVDAVIEVGGAGTLPKSLAAVRPGGTVALIGVLDQPGGAISPLPLIGKAITLAGTYVGSRAMFVAMNRFIEAASLHPIIDKVFAFENTPDAYAHQRSGSHLGKVVISLIE
jgi:NADPH:quinone reductase-like Zn-dependent oxidoreductase